MKTAARARRTTNRTLLYGGKAADLAREVGKHPQLELVEETPDTVVCYGGDGTLLSAERLWPGVPKAPIRNSRRGKRCIGHPAREVVQRLAEGTLFRNEYIKLECAVESDERPPSLLTAMNEFNVHMGLVNSAVRFTISLNDQPYDEGRELLGDGFVVCTPFGSTAYFKQITRGILYTGLGIGFKFPSEQVNHLVAPEDTVVCARISRGPAVLAFDNAPQYFTLQAGDKLTIRKHVQPAVVLTWDAMQHPTDAF